MPTATGCSFRADQEALPRGSGVLYIAGRNCPYLRVLSDFQKDCGEFLRAGFNQTAQWAMSCGRRKQQEQQSCEEIEASVAKANRCDEEEDRAHQERTDYELPDRITIYLPRLIEAAVQGS